MTPRFLDTNILIRYFTKDDENKARKALLLLQRVESGDEKVICSPMVIFETIFTLQRYYRMPRAEIREYMNTLISLRGLQLPNKHLYYQALDLYVSKNISFADCFNAVHMRHSKLSEIYTWDTDFDDIEGVVRVEPED